MTGAVEIDFARHAGMMLLTSHAGDIGRKGQQVMNQRIASSLGPEGRWLLRTKPLSQDQAAQLTQLDNGAVTDAA